MPSPAPRSIDEARQAYGRLVGRLRALRSRCVLVEALQGLCAVVGAGLGSFLALLGLEAALYLSPTAKVVLEVIAALVCIILFIANVGRPLIAPPSLQSVALAVEAAFGGLHQRVISALQLHDSAAGSDIGRADEGGARAMPFSNELAAAAVVQADEVASHLDLTGMPDTGSLRRSAAASFALILMTVSPFMLWADNAAQAANRLAHPLTEYIRPSDTSVALRPGDVDVIAGEPFEIVADISGVVPLQAQFETQDEPGGTWTARTLPVKRNRVRHRLDAVTRSIGYRLRANDAVTPVYRLTVRPRPMLVSLAHHLDFPAYTGLPGRTEEGGDIVAPAGSRVELQMQASIPIEEATLKFGRNRIPARVEGQNAVAEFDVAQDARYTVNLIDAGQITNADPVEYRIVALQDQAPQIRLLQPGADIDLGSSMSVPLVAEVHDDYGVAQIEIAYRVNDQPDEIVAPVPVDSVGARHLLQRYPWDLTPLSLFPGDHVTYRLRATDANALSGPGVGETPVFSIRFPSLLEIRKRAMQAEERGLQQLEAAQESGRELEQRLERIAGELKRLDEVEWSRQKEIETALADQKEMGKQLEKALQNLTEAVDQMEEGGALEPETLQRLQEVQELLRSIQSPEFQQAMQELSEALEDVDPESVEEALETFRKEQAELQENLERTIALLKRLRDQQNLDALVRGLDELAERQQDIATQAPDDPLGMSRGQEQLEKEAGRFEEELERAARDQASDEIGKELKGLGKEFRQQRITARMGQTAQDLRKDRVDQGTQEARSLASDLQQMENQLDAVRQQHVDRQKSEVAGDMDAVLRDLLTLSHMQEDAARGAKALRTREESGAAALEQARILSGAHRTAQRLMEISQKTFLLSPQAGTTMAEALKKMVETAARLQEPGPARASRNAQEAMGALNVTAMLVSRARQDLAAAASAMGFEEMIARLQEMAGQQQDVNAETQQQMQPGGQSPGGFGSLSAQQKAIQEALRRLQAEAGAQQDRVLGNLGGIASEIEDVVRDLNRRRVTPRTLDRQGRILSRLLDAQRSIRERGFSRQREARVGADIAYRGPGSLPADMGEALNPLRQKLRDALRQGYGPEYQLLIRRYFDRLIQDAAAARTSGVRRPEDSE